MSRKEVFLQVSYDFKFVKFCAKIIFLFLPRRVDNVDNGDADADAIYNVGCCNGFKTIASKISISGPML
jgi:hypothetical protein